MKWSALLLPLLLVSACASRQPAPVADLPPLARAALAEWEAWGRVVVEGWPDSRPADTAATPVRFARLLGYWEAVPDQAGVAQQLAARRAAILAAFAEQGSAEAGDNDEAGFATGAPGPEDISLYAHPAWSAAFISAVARQAGIAEADLPPAATHARYIDALLARALADPEGAPFRLFAPEERALRPGDLLCADRSARPLLHWTERLAETGRFRPMHCDIVVRAGPGMVEAVGGNVEDLVALRRLPADAEGRILPAPPDRPRFLLVLAPRAGMQPAGRRAWPRQRRHRALRPRRPTGHEAGGGGGSPRPPDR